MTTKILIIDDEEKIRETLTDILEDEGYNVTTAPSIQEGHTLVREKSFDLVLLDIWLSDGNGLELLKEIKAENPLIEVIMITGHGNIETAVKATKYGAFDFLEKPLSIERILVVINNALKTQSLESENLKLKRLIESKDTIIGQSQAIEQIRELIEQAALSDARVIITGENGTGKEIAAKSIHNKSSRVTGPFVAINSAAIPQELIESELFGHEKGAFTGAIKEKIGKLELSNGGTLLLDEIGDMNLTTQAKLLRVMEEMKFTRVGGLEEISYNTRIIAATNKDIIQEIREKKFREDLYYRINVLPIHIPPLRERKEDIPILTAHFINEITLKNKFPEVKIHSAAIKTLYAYDWPGNVRELRNIVERMIALNKGQEIKSTDIENYLQMQNRMSATKESDLTRLKDIKDNAEKEAILHSLNQNTWNISKTAKSLDIERSHLYKKMKLYGIEQRPVKDN